MEAVPIHVLPCSVAPQVALEASEVGVVGVVDEVPDLLVSSVFSV